VTRDEDDHDFGWSHIVVVGFCAIDFEWGMKHSKFSYEITDFDKMKTKKVPNTSYDPSIKQNEFPDFCERRICYTCIGKNCPYFAPSDLEDNIKERMYVALEDEFDKIVAEEEVNENDHS
jgi:hypothetical protein